MNDKSLESIIEIKLWLLESKFLPDRLHRNIIQKFLSSVEGNVEKAKYLISNYFFVRQCVPEIFTKRSPLVSRSSYNWHGSCFLPLKKSKNEVQVFLGAILDSNIYDFQVFVKQMYMCYDLLIAANNWDFGNRVLVFSFNNMKVENSANFNVYLIKKSMELQTKKYLPGRLKALHVVQSQPFMTKYIADFKLNLKGEHCKVIVHKSLKTLYNFVSAETLPIELGGSAGTIEAMARCPFYFSLSLNGTIVLRHSVTAPSVRIYFCAYKETESPAAE